MNITPIILSGGSGTRLWPLSREAYPKQYLPLVSEQTMLQETISRLDGVAGLSTPIVVCNAEHRFLVAEQLLALGIGDASILLEPLGRNTAPAICAAAYFAKQNALDSAEQILLVLSTDHLIQNKAAFHEAIKHAVVVAKQGFMTTFGVVPLDANTSYGYIEKSTPITNSPESYQVKRFAEKPNQTDAEAYFQSGNYLWNSGMFVLCVDALMHEMQTHSPDILSATQSAVAKAQKDLDFVRLDADAFGACPSDSIDYALMEKTDKAAVVLLDALWNDIGSWQALLEVSRDDADASGNIIKGDALAVDSRNCYIHADHHMVATLGVDDLIVVDTPDATLVAKSDKSQEVKTIVKQLQNQCRGEPQSHRKVYRPWGWYDSIDNGTRFQVKRIGVKPGAKLSLQMHHHRSEHWVVISGVATVVRGNETISLEANQSTYIPIKMKHALENRSDKPLEIIEIQCGDYLGEDDIVRFEDMYGRVDETN